MQVAFYPVLLSLLVLASLGVPIPEDIPLIVAGVLLKTHAGIASWPGTFLIALIGIMAGDLILFRLGRSWGPGVVNHRSVRWLLTPELFRKASQMFNRYGTWYCFFGRFFFGIRAAMCLTAGATNFPYWRFFLADFSGALLSIPLFVYLGYWFAGMLPTLKAYTEAVQAVITITGAVIVLVLIIKRVRRRRRRYAELAALRAADCASNPQAAAPKASGGAGRRDSSLPIESGG